MSVMGIVGERQRGGRHSERGDANSFYKSVPLWKAETSLLES